MKSIKKFITMFSIIVGGCISFVIALLVILKSCNYLANLVLSLTSSCIASFIAGITPIVIALGLIFATLYVVLDKRQI